MFREDLLSVAVVHVDLGMVSADCSSFQDIGLAT